MTVEDATARRVIEALPDGALVADATGTVIHLNTVAVDLLERPPGGGEHLSTVMTLQDLQGRDWYACVWPYDGLATRTRLLESSWRTTAGREVLVTGRFQRERPAGPVTQLVLCLRDGRTRERLDRERSDLVATVAHELRSPLTGVKGFTATLLAKWDRFTESQKQLMLRTVDADADRLTRLIAELLDVARIDTGRLSVRKQVVDVAEAVTVQLAPLSPPAGRSLSVRADGEARVWVDRDKLAQVVANLVENAIRHGDGDVVVAVAATDDGGAEIVVDDAGRGIDEAIRPRLFTKFWKSGSTGGSGLGLYIVHGLVAIHGGTVEPGTSPAGGARMTVRLPYGGPDVAPAPNAVASPSGAAVRPAETGSPGPPQPS